MQLKKFKCKEEKSCRIHKIGECSHIPIEILDEKKPIDIMICAGYPSKTDEDKNKPFSGLHGKPIRSIISYLEKKYKFNYILTTLVKYNPRSKDNKTRPLTKGEIETCSKNLNKEIKKYNPKVIIAIGETVHNYFHDLNKSIMVIEEGCLREITVGKSKYMSISTVSPAWCRSSDPNTIGFIFNAIEKAILYATKGVNFNIPNKYKSILLDNIKDVKKIIKRMTKTKEIVCVDTETANLNRVYDNTLFSIQLCNDGKRGYVIPISHYDTPFSVEEIKRIKKLLTRFFTTKKSEVTGWLYQGAKFDLHQIMRELNIIIFNAPVIDTMFNEFLLEENWERATFNFPKGKGPYSLYTICYKHGFTHYANDPALSKEIRKTLSDIPLKEWKNYAGADVVAPWNIYKSQLKRAKYQKYSKGFKKMSTTFNTHLTRTLTYIEHCGLPTSITKIRNLYSPRLSPLIKEIDRIRKAFNDCDSVKKLEIRLRKERSGMTKTLFGESNVFDPNKKSHREELFFEILELDPTSDNLSCDAAFQDTYKNVEEVALLTLWNKTQKLKTSYVDNIYKFMNKTTGQPDFYTDNRVRSSYSATAVTGRLRSYKPNGQQRPRKGDSTKVILEMYEANKSKCIMKIDYSAFEVRGLGIVSEDKAMIKNFKEIDEVFMEFKKDPDNLLTKKEKKIKSSKKRLEIAKARKKNLTDVHKKSGSTFYNKKIEEITDKERHDTKGIVFGLTYGMGDSTLAQDLKITIKDAKKLKTIFKKAMPDASRWLENIQKFGGEHLYVESKLGRRRRVWGFLLRDMGHVIAKMRRLCTNALIQGMCSDLDIIAASLITEKIYKEGLGKYQLSDEDAWMICNIVHDDIEPEIPITKVYEFLMNYEKFFTTKLLAHVKEHFDFDIKINPVVDVDIGLNLSDMRSWDGTKRNAKELQKWLIKEDAKRS